MLTIALFKHNSIYCGLSLPSVYVRRLHNEVSRNTPIYWCFSIPHPSIQISKVILIIPSGSSSEGAQHHHTKSCLSIRVSCYLSLTEHGRCWDRIHRENAPLTPPALYFPLQEEAPETGAGFAPPFAFQPKANSRAKRRRVLQDMAVPVCRVPIRWLLQECLLRYPLAPHYHGALFHNSGMRISQRKRLLKPCYAVCGPSIFSTLLGSYVVYYA